MKTNQSRDYRDTAEHFCRRAVADNNIDRAETYWRIAQTWIRMAQDLEEQDEVEGPASAKAPTPSPHLGVGPR